MSRSKIVLGTVQFGLDYGINNSRGKVPESEVFQILDYALKNGVNCLDTAFAYGTSQKILGKYLKIKDGKADFKIITKIKNISEVENSFTDLHQENIYGCLMHSFDKESLKTYEILSQNENIQKKGFSLYYPQDLEFIFSQGFKFDIIQIPYSIFDRRFEPYFEELKKRNVEIHTRSAFLQGLFFKDPDTLSNHFDSVKSKLTNLKNLAAEKNIPIVALCLNFIDLNKFVDGIVVGVDSLANFVEILEFSKYTSNVEDIFEDLKKFREDDENIILPFNWK